MTSSSSGPKECVAIIAALPRELAGLAKVLTARPVSNQDGIVTALANMHEVCSTVILVTAGMSSQRATLAFAAAVALGPVQKILSVGLAGACDPDLKPGDVLEASLVIDTQTGEQFETTPISTTLRRAILVTTPHIANPAEKYRLNATYNAGAVDMEAATIARLSLASHIPFTAIKVISDDHAVDVAPLSKFSGTHGQFRTGAFVLHTALRPHLWRSTITLGRNSSAALQNLTQSLQSLLVQPGDL